jgi:hypothetical protein
VYAEPVGIPLKWRMLEDLLPPASSPILDCGCRSGGLLAMRDQIGCCLFRPRSLGAVLQTCFRARPCLSVQAAPSTPTGLCSQTDKRLEVSGRAWVAS